MATSFASVLNRLFDDAGEELNGGKVYSYEAGTSTPLATYQDLAGATPNANPTILDASGYATIRLTDGVSYKLVVKDSDDNTVMEEDNVTVGTAASATAEELLVSFDYVGTPGAQATMRLAEFDRAVTFAANFEGSQASVVTAPSSSYAVDVQKNGVSVGTVTFDTAGTPTFATSGGATVAFTTGDVMKLVGPSSVGTAVDFSFTFVGDL